MGMSKRFFESAYPRAGIREVAMAQRQAMICRMSIESGLQLPFRLVNLAVG